ncbi:hypothetical protein SHI21_03520 [Bacteriovorax sp. PP10]|uniref:Uncharacterized protein n=1 Tax=Bacteriovorax antarcticus TaxID=3088717 RepID=A0ABU5VTA4_9BACT|nr:hypothetical protein [Bacteriovorax sp. PP10]MEA9355250.1 hypothetical protein [Bacteriovorax sp. PP10]
MKSLFTILALGLLTTTLAHAGLPVNESLTDSVTEKFYTQANDKNTGLNQVIKQVLGRNLSRSDFQVIALTTQTMRNPWTYAYSNPEKTTCTAGDNSSEFLILLRAKVKNPAAATFITYSFKVAAEQASVAVHKDGLAIDNCADVSENDGTYVIAPAANLIGQFVYVEIAEPKADPTQESH